MAFTADQLATLEAAIASGELRVQYSDRSVQYRSLADMIAIRNTMRDDLGLNGVNGAQTRKVLTYDKGLCNDSSDDFDTNGNCC